MSSRAALISVLTVGAVLLGTSSCGETAISPDETAAVAAKQLMQSACTAMISEGGSTWDATGEAVSYAEQAVEVSGGRVGRARNVTELYFAANIADIYAESQRLSLIDRRRTAPLRTAVSTVCRSFDPGFPAIWIDRYDESSVRPMSGVER
ncbi:MAG: hypothetical protein HOV67_31190 [Kribbellaceae bacterium]|nr:hypothetical protein [Kribbellaceae bacterium]